MLALYLIRCWTNIYYCSSMINDDLQVAGWSPGWAPLRNGLEQATYTCVHLLPKQYNLIPAKGVIYLAGKVIAGLVESNGSLPPDL